MKVQRARIVAAAAKLDPAVRVILLHGGDESASRDLADRFARQFADSGNPLSVETIAAPDLDKDPARLVAAASAVSMFGDRTLIRVDGADDDTLGALTQLLAGPPGNPVVLVAGTLRKGSKLLTACEAHPAVLAHASYAPSARDAQAAVDEIGAEFGLTAGRGAAARLFEACAGDRGVLRREVEKLALFLDASRQAPQSFEIADLADIGADVGDGEAQALVASIARGDAAEVERQLAQLGGGSAGITLLRALTRRLWQLLDLRQAVDGGASPESAVDGARPPVFWKDKAAMTGEVARWRTPMLRAALARLLTTERAIKAPGSAGDVLAMQALLGIAVQAAGVRR